MKQIKLHDLNIRHIECYQGFDLPEHFRWYRGPDYYDISVFTDHMLRNVAMSNSKYNVAWLMEPPCINKRHWDLMEKEYPREAFDYIITYSKEHIEKWGDKAIWFPGGGSTILKKDWKIYPKSKNILIVASQKYKSEGHRLRHEVINKFGDKMDVAGRGYKQFPEYAKAEIFKDYRIQVVVPNMIMEDVWSDRLIDCFLTGTVPIFWGGKFLHRYFNMDGILLFDNIKELAYLLSNIKEVGTGFYERKDTQAAIKDNFERAKRYAIIEDYLWENLFKKLMQL